ncbi:hypothetical protein BGM19_13195 [Streptomyces agglomeratus]|uniref:Uncharacterized protein n=1 Tax=Streptomyces agglomeratus TaxID=285458 RepID=A0A1E5PC05_9ACTN|nr:hypothetical protein [Streptomyces agglomeratus]OEJ27072.1 hypothetical protein AS594_23915 [Streptomyces agglomeratus]OEJ51407.1 hypothetical protein BGK72_12095 [Streptomyces agglomeratus]OEJ58808.1 hypothetical protein BGM19_13195 [Streptomyces agglomeratus]
MTYDADPDAKARARQQPREQRPLAQQPLGQPQPPQPQPGQQQPGQQQHHEQQPPLTVPEVGIRQPAASEPHPAPGSPPAGTSESHAPLIPQGERDKLALRLQQAVNTFVDGPRRAVEEADGVFEEAARRLTDAVAERRGSLRSAWAAEDREAETEELRIALRTYREATERLLRM